MSSAVWPPVPFLNADASSRVPTAATALAQQRRDGRLIACAARVVLGQAHDVPTPTPARAPPTGDLDEELARRTGR